MEEKKTWVGALLSRRQVIPRWHSPQSALQTGERDSIKVAFRPRTMPVKWLPLLAEQAGRADADQHASVELEEMRFVLGKKSTHQPPSPLISSPLLRAQQMWQKAAGHSGTRPPPRPDLGGDWHDQEQANVGILRRALGSYPQQPLLWSELARTFIVLGEDLKAKRAMACAVQLAGRSAYIRRSAARMFLHLGDPQQALKVVRDHPNFRGDPRMVSADVAIASRTNQPLRSAKHGLVMLEDANFRPSFLCELAAALGTVELEYGKHKRSRALFSRSMLIPSENALAQVQWATERDSFITIPAEAWQVPGSYEAHALAARQRLDWDSVLDAAEHWLNEEPFAIRPAMLGSFASFTSDQNQRAERLVSQALMSNPESASLYNNRAVARAYLGDMAGAIEDVRKAVEPGIEHQPYAIATVGLIGYRSGDHVLGAMGYKAAIAHFVKQKNAPSTLLASLFWLRELARIGDSSAASDFEYVRKNALRFTGGKPDPEIQSMWPAAGLVDTILM